MYEKAPEKTGGSRGMEEITLVSGQILYTL